MTDIKEPINTTSDGTFLSVVCENPEKSVVSQKLGGPSPPGITPCTLVTTQMYNVSKLSDSIRYVTQYAGYYTDVLC